MRSTSITSTSGVCDGRVQIRILGVIAALDIHGHGCGLRAETFGGLLALGDQVVCRSPAKPRSFSLMTLLRRTRKL